MSELVKGVVKGVVQAVNSNKINTKFGTKYHIGFMINGNWYNKQFAQTNNLITKGMTVEADYKVNEQGYNEVVKGAESLRILDKPSYPISENSKTNASKSSFQRSPTHPEDAARMARANALGHATAVALHNAKTKPVELELILELADQFVEYISNGNEVTQKQEQEQPIL